MWGFNICDITWWWARCTIWFLGRSFDTEICGFHFFRLKIFDKNIISIENYVFENICRCLQKEKWKSAFCRTFCLVWIEKKNVYTLKVIILQLYNKIFLILVIITKKSILENSKRSCKIILRNIIIFFSTSESMTNVSFWAGNG